MRKLLSAVLLVCFVSLPCLADVSFTFDDGYASTIQNAYPIFETYHVKGTVYVITGKVGSENFFMDWDDIHRLYNSGWCIGSHTVTHPDFSTLTIEQVRKELIDAKIALRAQRLPADHFAAPYGIASDEQIEEIMKIYKSNRLAWSTMDSKCNYLYNLDRTRIQTVELDEDTNLNEVIDLIGLSKKRSVWTVFMIHQVLNEPSTNRYHISTSKLKEIIEYAVGHNVPVVTVDQYLRRAK